MNIKNFISGLMRNGMKAALLLAFAAGMANIAKAQLSFAAPQVIGGDFGSVNNTNLTVADVGAPAIAGFPAVAPLWYQWTASHDGEVELDTVGSDYALDTVLGVFSGPDVAHLNQLAANDDLYPINRSLAIVEPGFSVVPSVLLSPFTDSQYNFGVFSPLGNNFASIPLAEFYEPYYGPSHLRFTAKGGQTYYFAVDAKGSVGNIVLNWAYKSSGVFRFASEDNDPYTGAPLYQTFSMESVAPNATPVDRNSVVGTYYNYNAPGALVTITRSAGSKGRVYVDYTTVDGPGLTNAFLFPTNVLPAFTAYTNYNYYITADGLPATGPGGATVVTNIAPLSDYSPVSGRLVFDDFEMSKTILLPINRNGGYLSNPRLITNVVSMVNGKTTYTPVAPSLSQNPFPSSQNSLYNAVFGVVITNVELDPLEASDVAPPRVDPLFGEAEVKILNSLADPYGPDIVPIVISNVVSTNLITLGNNQIIVDITNMYNAPSGSLLNFGNQFELGGTLYNIGTNPVTVVGNQIVYGSNMLTAGTLPIVFFTNLVKYGANTITLNTITNATTNLVMTLSATNYLFNFEKAYYRVPADVDDPAIAPYNWATATIYVERTGTNTGAMSVNYRVNNELQDNISSPEYNNEFPLSPGSDYAIPLAGNNTSTIRNYADTNGYDFDVQEGTLSFPAEPAAGSLQQPIHIKIPVSKLTKFNKDFRVELYRLVKVGNTDTPEITGMNPEATVTILFNDENPPAGSVDELFNPDFIGDLALLPSSKPQSFQNAPQATPGVGSPGSPGQVYSIGVLTNDEALIGGDFSSYNGATLGGLALISTQGLLDQTFNTGSGVGGDLTLQGNDSRVNAVAISGSQYYIAGNFTSYNGKTAIGIARLNSNGSLDTTFSLASPPDGVIRAIQVLPSGKILIGGDFTHIDNATRNYVAQLNPDGSLDTTFDPASNLSGPVYSLATPVPPVSFFDFTNGSALESDQLVNFGVANAGVLTLNYNMEGFTNNDIQVYYGADSLNPAAGSLIFDSGVITSGGAGTFTIPFNPVNGLTTNVITVVMNPGGIATPAAWEYNGTITFPNSGSGIMVGGGFAVNGQLYTDVARLNSDGTLDTTFNPVTGADGIVHSIGWQFDGHIVLGGEFTHFNGNNNNYLVRLNNDGSIDTSNWFTGIAADDIVNSVTLQFDGTMYIGGAFENFNGTRRSGFARLYPNGTVDTTFMDTAYNQFAGIKKVFSDDPMSIFASAVQSSGGVLIGGSFLQVGGGQADTNVDNTLEEDLMLPELGTIDTFVDPNEWVEPKARDGYRNRIGFARLIGGWTPGPGNIALTSTSYSQSKSQANAQVSLVRSNGTLGAVSANFVVLPGLAQPGQDYTYQAASPLFWIAWDFVSSPSRQREDGLWGVGGSLSDALGLSLPLSDKTINNLSAVNVGVHANSSSPGNLNAQFQLANPSLAESFYLGGLPIPLGAALGASTASFTLVDDTTFPGQFGFSSPTYVATSNSVIITMLRSNGTFGKVSMLLNTTNGTALAGAGKDYIGVTNKPVVFNTSVTTVLTNITILNNGSITNVEKTFNVKLSNLGTTPGATFGISNAVVRIINPNYPGYVTLSTTNYGGTTSSGMLNFVINRVVGSFGRVSVQYATADGSAVNGVDYVGTTNTVSWDNTIVSPQIISIPLLPTGSVGTNKTFNIRLLNATNALLGVITNAIGTITNDNSYGAIQLSSPTYNVNENGGYVTITALRTGGQVGTVSVNYATQNGTAIAGSNYVGTAGVLVMTPGQTVASFNVPVLHDGAVDPANFNFFVNLSNATNAILGSLTNAQVNIFDVDATNWPSGSPDQSFNPDTIHGDVFAVALQTNGQVLVAGNFNAVGAVPEGGLARLNGQDGSLDGTFLNGASGANGAVNAMVVQTDGRILVGGAFTAVNGANRNFFGRLMTDGSVDTSFNPGAGADNVVNAIAEDFAVSGTNINRKIYLGGAFGNVGNFQSQGIIRLNNDCSVDTGFSVGSGAAGQVYAIAVYPTWSAYAGKVLVGGSFSQFNGFAVTNLVRLNADGSVDTNYCAGFGAGPGGPIRALSVQASGQVLVGGNFTNFNGVVANNLVRLNVDGTLDTSFVAANGTGANNDVEGLLTQPDNRIVVVGQFTKFNGVTRNHITRLMPNGGIDPTINFGFGANGDVDSVVIQPADGKLVIGGAFTQYDNQAHAGVARIYGGSVTGSGAFTFLTSQFYANENALLAPVTILRAGGTSGTNADFTGNVTVNFATAAGTAVPGINYQDVNTNVVFPEGEVAETVLVPVIDDNVVTPTLTVQMSLSNPTSPATLTNQTAAILNIINVDSAVTISNAFPAVAKNTSAGQATVTLLRTGGTNNPCSVVFYTTTNGTAIVGTDYYPTNTTITFVPGQTNAEASIPIINNNLAEGNRTVSFAITNVANAQLIAPTNGVLTIIDTVTAPGQLFFSTTNFVAGSGDGEALLTVLRSNGFSGPVSVTYNTVPGTAQPGVNYVTASGPLTFGNGETVKQVIVPLVNNHLAQAPVQLSVVLSNPTGGATLTVPTNTTLTILNTNVGFAFTAPTNAFLETSGTVPVFVQRVGSTGASVSVNYATTIGTAQSGVNYTPVSGTLQFGVGESLKAISLPLIYDPAVTGDLNVNMQLSSPSAGTVLASPSNSVVVIQDADAGLSFTNANMSVLRSTGAALITVICSNTNVEPVIINSNTVPLSVQYATADGTAQAGVDYVATSGTLIFTNGIATNTFVVPLILNSLVTGDKSFTINLLNPTAPGKLVAPSVQTVTILNNNTGFRFSQPTYVINKDGVAATITVLRTGYTNNTATVDFIATNGTAISPNNYVATNGTLLFTNGVTSQTFTIGVVDSTATQPDLTVLMQLLNPTNAFLVSPNAATLTIHDTSGSYVVPDGATLTSEIGAGAPNGIIDSNETVTALFGFRAAGGTNVANLVATLLTTNGVTSPSGAQAYGPLVVGSHGAFRSFTFTAKGTNAGVISPTFQLSDGVKPIGTNIFTFTLGTWTTSFTNNTPIIINPNTFASPYPASVNVSGVGGALVKATLTLTNLNANYGAAVSMLLVSPSAADTLLMANAGSFYQINQATITFDDAATNALPQSAPIVSGTNKPTSYGLVPSFP